MDHAPSNMTDRAIRWHGYSVVAGVYGLAAVVLGLAVTVPVWLPSSPHATPLTTALPAVLVGAYLLALLATSAGAMYGYVADARALDRHLFVRPAGWIVAQLVAGPLAALYYLHRRRDAVGNDFSGSWLTTLPDFSAGRETQTFFTGR